MLALCFTCVWCDRVCVYMSELSVCVCVLNERVERGDRERRKTTVSVKNLCVCVCVYPRECDNMSVDTVCVCVCGCARACRLFACCKVVADAQELNSFFTQFISKVFALSGKRKVHSTKNTSTHTR